MFDGLLQFVACRIRNRRMPNGTYGGVRGRKMKVGGNDYIIFLLLDAYMRIDENTEAIIAFFESKIRVYKSIYIVFSPYRVSMGQIAWRLE